VYVYQAGYLTELALGLAAMAVGKPIDEVQQQLAQVIASQDWSDRD
jgi:hypothetical protein